jgi:hypothetical protein
MFNCPVWLTNRLGPSLLAYREEIGTQVDLLVDNAKLFADVFAMHVYGAGRYAQKIRRFFGGFILLDQVDDLNFRRRLLVECIG